MISFKQFIAIMIIMVVSAQGPALAIDQNLLLKLLELRRESYLRRKGELSITLTPIYSQDKAIYPGATYKSQNYNLNARIDLGLTDRLEVGLSVPFTSMNRQVYVSSWETYRGAGMGDPRLNFQFEMLSEKVDRPAAYLTGGLRMPLGKSQYDDLYPGELAPGSGYYAANLGLSFLKSIDPAALFWGFDYQLAFPRGDRYPSDVIGYNMGLAWSLNQSIGLVMSVSGAVVGEDKEIVSGAERTLSPAYNLTGLSIGSNVMLGPGMFINPNIFFGLTDEESDLILSMGISIKR